MRSIGRSKLAVERLKQSTADLVAEVLRDEIVDGRIAPDEEIRQDAVASRLGVSKIPVREALRTLQAEGFVVFAPRRSTVAAGISEHEVNEAFEIRLALEPLLLGLAVPRLAKAELDRAAETLDVLDHEHDRRTWGRLNWEFHKTLYAPARYPMMLRILETVHGHVDRFFRLRVPLAENKPESRREHAAILKACAQHNATRACALLREHIEGAERIFAMHARREDSAVTQAG